MKSKSIFITIFLVMILIIVSSEVKADCTENWIENNTLCNTFNYTINYYDANNCSTVVDLPFTNGTIVDCACHPSWSQDVMPCINGVKYVSYTDINTCNVTTNIPINNATNEYCSLIPQTDNTPYIIFIVLGIFLLISFVGALMLHEAFFGMCALIIAFMMTTFIYYKYPVVLDVLCMFMILLFAVMWVVIARAKR